MEMGRHLEESISRWDARRKQAEEEEERRRASEEDEEEAGEEEREREEERRLEAAEQRAREEEEAELPEERAEREAQEQREQERAACRRQRNEQRRAQDRENERRRVEERGACMDLESHPPSPIPPSSPPAAPADMRREVYNSMFRLAGTSPLHALCMNKCVNDELMGDVVQGMCQIQVWVGGEDGGVWPGEDDGKALGLISVMARSPCDYDAGRLPLHAACVNRSCSASCLACKRRMMSLLELYVKIEQTFYHMPSNICESPVG